MDAHLRNAYLDALGIDRWVSRDATSEVVSERENGRNSPPVAPPDTAAGPELRPFSLSDTTSTTTLARAPLPAGIDWTPLREAVAACTACDLCKTRTQTVFGVGDIRAEWLVIGEAPGADEDRQGEPFVGRAGQLLNSMLLAIGLPRETVFIANVL